jgi:hypothetical protein
MGDAHVGHRAEELTRVIRADHLDQSVGTLKMFEGLVNRGRRPVRHGSELLIAGTPIGNQQTSSLTAKSRICAAGQKVVHGDELPEGVGLGV